MPKERRNALIADYIAAAHDPANKEVAKEWSTLYQEDFQGVMMRHRIEDLGRLAVLIQNLLDHQLFDDFSLPSRRKDYWDWFSELSEEKKDDAVRHWVYGIDNLRDKLYEMLEIAEGKDSLNENSEGQGH